MPDNSPNHPGHSPVGARPGGRWRRILWFFCIATLVYSLLSSYQIVYQMGWHLGSVSGTVTVDGKPIPEAKLLFVPIDHLQSDEQICPISIGRTDKNGRFWLQTIDGRKGAVVGRHLVYVSTKDVDVSTDGEGRSRIRHEEKIPVSHSTYKPKTVVVGWFGGNRLKLEYHGKKAAG